MEPTIEISGNIINKPDEWRAKYPREATIHELFEQQARAVPKKCALRQAVFREEKTVEVTISYEDLDGRSNQLAWHLLKLGVSKESFVAVYLDRSIDSIVAILAILKAGGAYVPLDPAYPVARLSHMLQDTAAPILITRSSLAERLSMFDGRVVDIDKDRSVIEKESKSKCPVAVAADSLAYVMYTSGSTGKPKGVCIPHRGVVRLVRDTNYVEFSAEEVFLQFAPISFDASTFEIWGSLLNAAELVIFPPNLPSLEQLGDVIARYRISTLWLTAALFREMVDCNIASLSGVRQLLAGGEALSVPHVQKALEKLPLTRLINGYGPTENTTFTCCHAINEKSIRETIPIGRPISNTTVYILDEHLNPVAQGEVGEIYTGGDGLARGYLNAPDLTAQKFIRNPFSDDSNDRLYRIGDIVRQLPNGEIEFLGRVDGQIKIRGFRIELGEIERRIDEHPSVKRCVVTAEDSPSGIKRLIAYVLPKSIMADSRDLKGFVGATLPDYMVPSAFVKVSEIPLSANGKIDRKALAQQNSARSIEEAMNEKSSNGGVEAELATIWKDALGLDSIRSDEDFFEAGAHSLSTLRVISIINNRWNVNLQPVDLQQNSCIARLAKRIHAIKNGDIDNVVSRTDSLNDGQAQVDLVAAKIEGTLKAAALKQSSRNSKKKYRMREEWFCSKLIAPLYRFNSRSFRTILERAIFRFEGGPMFTVTLRKLYKKHFRIEVGDYSEGCFDIDRIQYGTKIGRYTGIFPTVQIRNADHPRNTISSHGVFYHPAFGFSSGLVLPRKAVNIGSDVWIGHNATLLYPTTTIGHGAVIAAGSVVVGDVPPYAIVGGYPATVLRYRFSEKTIEKLLRSKWWEASLEDLEDVREEFMKPLEGDVIR
jgi:amino acid adenylation domain-containing protein